ncbi:MAG: IS1595 family transposase [Chloroflexi bacterium]|nr:IS1595 family transposase [Chloroflexota bacterium]
MAFTGPGKAYRDGISLINLFNMFPDDETAGKWFEDKLWPKGPFCPRCGSFDVQSGIKHGSMTHRCRSCPDKRRFSLKTGSVMEGSKLGYRVWVIAIFLCLTSLKGVSSMKLHRDLGITQKAAWHLAHRLRRAFEEGELAPFAGPTEIDETFVGGRKKRGIKGRGAVGKAIVAGAKDRVTKQVSAKVIPNVRGKTLQRFVVDKAEIGSQVYTDDAGGYRTLPWHHHEVVRHGVGEYVRDQAHTQGIESFWSMLKRAYDGTYHKMSFKHLDRYVGEFTGRHNMRELGTMRQMEAVAKGMRGKRLRLDDLTADNGLPNGARGG